MVTLNVNLSGFKADQRKVLTLLEALEIRREQLKRRKPTQSKEGKRK